MRKEYIATIDGVEVAVRLEHAGGQWNLVVDGRDRPVDAERIRPGSWSLLVDGRSYRVDLDTRASGRVLMVNGREAAFEIEDARRKLLARAAGRTQDVGSGEVMVAPIAGRVVKLLVGVGDQVEVNQGVVVLEAMKMENELKATRGGVVDQIHTTVGSSVEMGDRLATLV